MLDLSGLRRNDQIDPNGNLTSYSRDADGNVTSRTNALGNSWTASFNDFDEQTRATGPLAASGCDSLSPPGDHRRRHDLTALLGATETRQLQPLRHHRQPRLDNHG